MTNPMHDKDALETFRQNRKNALYFALADVLDVLHKIKESEQDLTWTAEDIRAMALTLMIDFQRKYPS